MQIIREKDAATKQLGREQRSYFQSEQLRAVITRLPPGHVQNEHRHERLYDAAYVLEGEIEVSEVADNEPRSERASAGDFVVFRPGAYHNVANRSEAPAVTLTLKFLHDPQMDADTFNRLCETDWMPAEVAEKN
jgi:quercetin dioxygenase-like cupin family protein